MKIHLNNPITNLNESNILLLGLHENIKYSSLKVMGQIIGFFKKLK